ncbi:hypothetical protein [Pedobacter psychroterrae]|nr:hypothetical protein [Pedobacter psychroterrae]
MNEDKFEAELNRDISSGVKMTIWSKQLYKERFEKVQVMTDIFTQSLP